MKYTANICKFIKIMSKRNINLMQFSLIKSTIYQKLILCHSNTHQTSNKSHNKRSHYCSHNNS